MIERLLKQLEYNPAVIPAAAGIRCPALVRAETIDSRCRGNDVS